MNFHTFERAARSAFGEIPDHYKAGVDGLTVRKAPKGHPRFPDVYTLGECLTESYPSDWSGPDTLRSVVVLHWGSFRALARLDPDFDWDEQIWETLTHELRHHLESLADEDDLTAVDHAMEQGFQRREGLDFEPDYYRLGERLGPGVWAVEDEVFLEQVWTSTEFARATRISFAWAGREYEVARPQELGDVHYVQIVGGIPAPPYLELVLVRSSTWLQRARRALARTGLDLLESDAVAREVGR